MKTPTYAAEIVKTCVTLHNLRINVEGQADDEEVLRNNIADWYNDVENEQVDEDEDRAPARDQRRQDLIQLFNI